MRFMIASDIHGSAKWCDRLAACYRASGAKRLILLGDLLYHGPRNDLPEDYAPKRVIAALSDLKRELLCVRGNCEAEVDQMVLPFPCMADYAVLPFGEKLIYLTHGHRQGPDDPPPHMSGDLLICGHTHLPAFERREDFLYINPGSVSLPKHSTPHGAILWEDERFDFIDLATGEVYRRETAGRDTPALP